MPYYYSNVGATVEVGEIAELAKGSLIVGDGSGAPTEFTVGTNGKVLTADSSTPTGVKWETSSSSGESNTASNENAGGVGVFIQKTGVNLEFKGINAAASNRITVTDDAGNAEIDLDIDESKLSFSRIFALMGV